MPTTTSMRNREGLVQFDIEWGWASGKLETGFTAVLRVKDEALNLPFVLPPLLRSLAHVLVIDNGSTDGTPEVARQVAAAIDAGDRLEVVEYPFAVSRCGSEHLNTPADSVHSLTYFYNWAFSQVRTTYTLKWDGDMVLTGEGEHIFQDLTWQLEREWVVVKVPRYGLYLESDDVAWIDPELQNREPWSWPNAPGFRVGKGFEWEIQLFPGSGAARWIEVPDGVCFEIKRLDSDEFSHWSSRDFGDTRRTERKRRELHIFEELAGHGEASGLIRMERGDRSHVIDMVTGLSVPAWAELAPGASQSAP